VTEIAFPLRVGPRGRTETSDEARHVEELIEQVLFTAPGERVNRPTFGSGLSELVFAPGGEGVAEATQMLVQGALQQWLGDRVVINALEAESEEATLRVSVRYTLRGRGEPRTARFEGAR